MAARKVGRPVKLELTRQQMFTSVGYRAQTLQRVALGATRDGKLVSMIHANTNLTSPYDEFTEKSAVVAPMLYACPNVSAPRTDLCASTGERPPASARRGKRRACFALESAMDELAYALNLDPMELRLRQLCRGRPAQKTALVEQGTARMLPAGRGTVRLEQARSRNRAA